MATEPWKICEFCDAKVSPYPEPDRCPHCHKPVVEVIPLSSLEELREELKEAREALVLATDENVDHIEARSNLRDALVLVGESTNDPRILAITRKALLPQPMDGGDGGG
jgi:hypothetical protein